MSFPVAFAVIFPSLCHFAALSCLLSLILGKQCFSGDDGILPHYRLPCQMSSLSANYYSAVDAAIGQAVLFASHSFSSTCFASV